MNITEMSIMGGIMILAVIVMHALGVNKLPKRAFIVMWEIVLLRLLLPVSIPLPILPAVTVPEVPSISAPSAQHSDYTAPSLFMPNYDMYVPEDYTTAPVAPAVPVQPQIVKEPSAQPVEKTSTPKPQLNISFGAVYAVGTVAIALFFALSYVHGIRKFRTSLPVENDYVSDWLYIRKGGSRISVRYSDRIASPLTYGILRPVILLPKDADLSDQKRLAYILEHEYAHIRHFDSLKKIIAALALCLHWFNPLVWAMYLLYNRDMELWCDECVIKRFGEKSRANYARMLITMEELKSGTPLMSYFRKNSVEERIILIMKYKKKTVVSVIAAVLLVAAVTAAIIATSVNPVPRDSDSNVNELEYSSDVVDVIHINSDDGISRYIIKTEDGQEVLTDEEFEARYPALDIEWWTYDEFKEWLENEKVELQGMIGETGWTGGRGKFVWTQEIVDEAIERYEAILEDIKNGMLYSKTIDGEADSDVVVSYDPDNIGTFTSGIKYATAPKENTRQTNKATTPLKLSTLYAGGQINVIKDFYKGVEAYSSGDENGNSENSIYLETGAKAVVIIDLETIDLDEYSDPGKLNCYFRSIKTYSGFTLKDRQESSILTARTFYHDRGGRVYVLSLFEAPADGVYEFFSANLCDEDTTFYSHWVQLQSSDNNKDEVSIYINGRYNGTQPFFYGAKSVRATLKESGYNGDAGGIAVAVISYIQPSSGDLSTMKNYFDYTKKRWEVRDEVPIIEDPKLYAAATDTLVESDIADSMIYPSISVVSGDECSVFAVIEVDTKDLVLPADIPEDAVLQFKGASENFYNMGAWYPLEFTSQNGTVYSYAYSCFNIGRGLPDEVVFELRDYGYYDGEEFVTLVKGTYRLIIDSNKFNTTEKLKKISGQMEVKGATLNVALTPYGVKVYGSISQLTGLGLLDDKYFLIQGNIYELNKRDGSTIGDWDGDFYKNGIYNLTSNWNGWRDPDKDIACYGYGFNVPVDVDEIEAVTVHGVRFDLKYAE